MQTLTTSLLTVCIEYDYQTHNDCLSNPVCIVLPLRDSLIEPFDLFSNSIIQQFYHKQYDRKSRIKTCINYLENVLLIHWTRRLFCLKHDVYALLRR